jgi:glyoxylase-like metal-dependent hydrolase (beta-lactamase superfamily II)
MRIHHLNCGTLYPLVNHWIQGCGTFRNRPPLVTHCLLIETSEGLMLVDTGFGTRDYTQPTPYVKIFIKVSYFKRNLEETAIYQVRRLGYDPVEVKYIAVTHMHLDHVGGLQDFRNAKVHIFSDEYQAITDPQCLEEREICRREHWAYGPDWVIHECQEQKWFGFDCTPATTIGDTEFFFVPLPGHTRGHSAVVIRTPDGWLMHCGDAYVYHGGVDPEHPYYPPKYRLALQIMGLFTKAFRVFELHAPRLRALLREHGGEVEIFCSHDPLEYAKYQSDFKS